MKKEKTYKINNISDINHLYNLSKTLKIKA